VSFTVAEGDALALIGPNGSGKTTTLKCMAGLLRPTSGAVRIGDLDPASVRARRRLSYLPQRVAFEENLTCREVLAFYARLRKLASSRIAAALAEWGLDESAGRPVHELSGGMLQRLGLAVATLPDAPVLLLDEPGASLDPAAALTLRRSLQAWKAAGKALVFASHSLADVEAAADRVAVFLDGRVAAIEPLKTFRRGLHSASLEEVYLSYVHATADVDRGRARLERLPAPSARPR
jgi:ABC-type multidrug transport system ATPase subunit